MRILICTDSAILHSGLAETSRHIFIPLMRAYPGKYDIHQLGYFHHGDREPAPWPIYHTKLKQEPNGQTTLDMADKYGEQSFDQILQQVQPDIVFGYGDLWHFSAMVNSPYRNNYRLVAFYTVDGEPYYGNIRDDQGSEWGRQLARADTLVCLSHFGRRVLQSLPELVDKEIRVMSHPLDFNRYPAYTDEQIKELRSRIMPRILAEDGFLCGWVGRNQFRKQNHKLWELCHYMVHGDYIQCKDCGRITIKEWDPNKRESRDPTQLTLYSYGYEYDYCWHCKSSDVLNGTPDPLFYLWLHMSKNEPGYNCNLEEHIWKVRDHCIYTSNLNQNRTVSKEDVARLLAIWDVMYYPSGGEGFGNPALECMAAGTPLLFSNYSAHAEFSRFGGLPIRVATYIPELGISIRRSVIDINHALEQMLKLRRDQKLRKDLGNAGRLHASNHAITQTTPAWDRIFTDLIHKPLPSQSSNVYAMEVS